MKLMSKLWVLPLAALALLAPLAALAQTIKPVAVVSIASIKENLADVAYLTRIAGMEDAGKSAMFFGNALTAGVNKDQPIGLYVVPKAGDFHGVAFLPVSDLKVLLEVHKEQIGTPKDVGNGILEIGAQGKTAFIKEQGGWAFVTVEKEHLEGLPAEPVSLLGDLPKKYNVAGKILVQNIPAELRRMAIDQLKVGVERALDSPALQQGGANPEDAKKAVQAQLSAVEKLLTESDEIVVGLGVNAETKSTYLDFSFTAQDGTTLAKQMALQMDAKSSLAGFLLPEASLTFSLTQKTTPEEIQQVGPALKMYRAQAMKHIDDAPDFPMEKRDGAKAVVGQMFDVLEKSFADGKIEMGGSLVLLPKSLSFAAGGYIGDGAAMEKALKDLVALLKDQPDFPKVQFDAGNIGDVKLHKLTAPIPNAEPEARELLGDKLEVIVGIGPKKLIVTGGKNAESLLKQIIEKSAADASKTVAPFQLNVSLLPILKFYQSVDNNPIVAGVLSSLQKTGGDKISISSQAGPRSSTIRLEIQEGIIKAIGESVKAFGAGFDPNAL